MEEIYLHMTVTMMPAWSNINCASSPSYGNGGGWWYYMPVDIIIRLIHAHRLTILSGTI